MSKQQQPKEHCGHECICWFAHGGMRPGERVSGPCCIPCKHDTRSRPHPAPAQIGFTEFCDIHCDHYECCKDERTKAARKAREDVLEQISKKMKHDLEFSEQYEDKTSGASSTYYGSRAACLSHYLEFIESLRQQQGTREQPR